MTRSREKYLHDMLDSCRFLLGFTDGESVSRFENDRAFRSAVERELQIIGEAMVQLYAIDRATAERIPEHRRIIGFRHVLVHGYDAIESEVVWHVVTGKLPVLCAQLESLLEPSG